MEKGKKAMKSASGKMKIAGRSVGQGSYFDTPKPKYAELKKQLNGNSTKEKLDAMKRLVAMMSKGRDVSEFFPDVVKNVVCSSLEVKKHVYMYLVHYAGQEQDLALLAINSFQRDLDASNQLIRALSLRVLSSIRVEMIAQLVVMAIAKCSSDGSAFVRKTAALAIPKVFSLDIELKDELEGIIMKLLKDKSTMVLGAAVVAFLEVCPDKLELIHPVYRKLCHLLPDIDEWGQIASINMLIRYCRTQFEDTFAYEGNRTADRSGSNFYLGEDKDDDEEDEEDDESDDERKSGNKKGGLDAFYAEDDEEDEQGQQDGGDGQQSESGTGNKDDELMLGDWTTPVAEQDTSTASASSSSKASLKKNFKMDPDLRLFLDKIQSLLQSRNSGVVLAVATAYYYLAPAHEAVKAGKALTRVLRNKREIQYVILANIATMATTYPTMFQPYLKEFWVRETDPRFIKQLKLEVISRCANEHNIGEILAEFGNYIKSFDKKFVGSTIQAIGHCAFTVPEVTERCLIGLMALAKNSSELVVGEAVVVIKKLLQLRPDDNASVIIKLAKSLETISVPAARASIVWVVGEYIDQVSDIGPDVLRIMAKTFLKEDDSVKLQVLNLGAKLFLTNAEQCQLLVQYVLGLAKYDINYDIRDRARMISVLLLGGTGSSGSEGVGLLTQSAAKLFLTEKPTPVLESPTKDRSRFMLNTLTHTVGHTVDGYEPIPDFPEEPPVTNRNEPEVSKSTTSSKSHGSSSASSTFYSDEEDEESSEYETDDDSGSFYTDSDEESSEYETDSDEESSEYETDSDEESSDFSSGEESEEEVKPVKKANKGNKATAVKQQEQQKKKSQSALDLLGDLDFNTSTLSTSSGFGGMDSPLQANTSSASIFGSSSSPMMTSSSGSSSSSGALEGTTYNIPQTSATMALLNHMNAAGLNIDYCFLRRQSIFGQQMNTVQLTLRNHKDYAINNITCEDFDGAEEFKPFDLIDILGPESEMTAHLNINFNMKITGLKFTIVTDRGRYPVSMSAPIGELLSPYSLSKSEFETAKSKLGGMNAQSKSITFTEELLANKPLSQIPSRLLNKMNMSVVSLPSKDDPVYRLAAKTMNSKEDNVLISLEISLDEDDQVQADAKLVCNSDSMMLVHSLCQLADNALKEE
eukprot:TRINITY_DN1091_c0_g1_i3.p1 TRINITY_DN1091_c0_g1~~TRINITY_DN1091_c0_g1_i3.p1  ORF type:complete len:1160 (-),score=485.32 TRINITY_DN1091_c0_g1_i3:900-4343(-)